MSALQYMDWTPIFLKLIDNPQVPLHWCFGLFLILFLIFIFLFFVLPNKHFRTLIDKILISCKDSFENIQKVRIGFKDLHFEAFVGKSNLSLEIKNIIRETEDLLNKFQIDEAYEHINSFNKEKRIQNKDFFDLDVIKKIIEINISRNKPTSIINLFEQIKIDKFDDESLYKISLACIDSQKKDKAVDILNNLESKFGVSNKFVIALKISLDEQTDVLKIEEEVPVDFREEIVVLYSLLVKSAQNNDFTLALNYAKRIEPKLQRNIQKIKHRFLMGQCLFSPIYKWSLEKQLPNFNEEIQEQLIHSIELYESCFQAINKESYEKYCGMYYFHLANSYKLVGKPEEALKAISNINYNTFNNDDNLFDECKLLHGEIFIQLNSIEEAKKIFLELKNHPKKRIRLIALLNLFSLLARLNLEDAINIGNEIILDDEIDNQYKEETRANLVSIYCNNKQAKEAQEVFNSLNFDLVSELNKQILQYQISKTQNKEKVDYIVFLIKASEHLNTVKHEFEKRTLANYLYDEKEFKNAVEIYRNFIDKSYLNPDNQEFKNYVHALYEYGEYTEALKLAMYIREHYGCHKFFVDIEGAVCRQHFNDYVQAKKIYEAYLNTYPDDTSILIELAYVYYKLNMSKEAFDKVKGLDLKKLNLGNLFLIAGLYCEVGKVLEGLEIGYKARNKFFNDKEAHRQYVGLNLNIGKRYKFDTDFITKPNDAVCIGDAVEIDIKQQDSKWFILESDKDNYFYNGSSINSEKSLAKKILGAKIGDPIDLTNEDEVVINQGQVKSIINKYQFAFNESIRKSGWLIKLENPDSPDELLNLIEELQGDRSSRIELLNNLQQMYKKKEMCLGSMNKILSKNEYEIIELWYYLISIPDFTFMFNINKNKDRDELIKKVCTDKQIVFDLITLLLLNELELNNLISKTFPNSGVTQSTVDLIKNFIDDLKTKQEGSLSIGIVEGKTVSHEQTSDQIKSRKEKFESLLDWITVNLKIVVPIGNALLNASQKKVLDSLIGQNFNDTVNACFSSKDYILCSSDENFQELVFNECRIDSINIFDLIDFLKNSKLITESKSIELEEKLQIMNYFRNFQDNDG
jgi:hypothetical protein